MVQTNFHTHTRRCMHAWDADEDMVREAIAQGFKVLGFSDHGPWKYDSDHVASMRMPLDGFQDYKESVRRLQEVYKGQIEILLGLESEYFPRYMDWFREFVKRESLDFVILGQHFHGSDEHGVYFGNAGRDMFDVYIDDCIEGLKTGLFAYLAHPDLPLRGMVWDEGMRPGFERLCEYCANNNIPLEYNVLGMHNGAGYPDAHFWQIAGQFHCLAIIGMDAHCMQDLKREWYEQARGNLEKLGMTIVDFPPAFQL